MKFITVIAAHVGEYYQHKLEFQLLRSQSFRIFCINKIITIISEFTVVLIITIMKIANIYIVPIYIQQYFYRLKFVLFFYDTFNRLFLVNRRKRLQHEYNLI